MTDKKKVDCKYGENCYQKNPAHHEKYNHPWDESSQLQVAENKQKRSPSQSDSESEKEAKRYKMSPRKKSPLLNLNVEKGRSKSRSKSPQVREKKSPSTSTRKSPTKNKQRAVSPKHESSGESEKLLKVSYGKHGRKNKSPSNERSPTKSPKHASPMRDKSPKEEKRAENTESAEPDHKNVPGASKDTCSSQEKLRERAERKEMDITKEYEEVMKNLSKSNYFEIFQRRVRYSKNAEYQDLLKTPDFMRHKFLVEMPLDFFKFWEFCESAAKKDQKPATVFEKLGLKLVGPFDYLAGKFHEAKIVEPGDYLRHWRFYYDPPEFQTIFVMSGTEVHYGYWRDDPKDKENLLVARNDSKTGFEFDFVGGNCFEAVLYFLEKDVVVTPFNRGEISNIKKRIQKFTEEHKIPIDSLEKLKKARNARVVCKTFHKAGLVVPFDRKTQVGYRNLMETDANIRKIISKIAHAQGNKNTIASAMEDLQSVITAANIAVDECDFGTSVELGIDLFCSGRPELHELVNQLLVTGYSMLKRPQFIAIMKAHLENRRKGNDLDMLK